MKTLLYRILSLSIVLMLFLHTAMANNAEELISINFGSTIKNTNYSGLLSAQTVWNNIYKGNSGFLLDNNTEQTTCFIQTNSIKTVANIKYSFGEPAKERYILSENIQLQININSIPYNNFDIYVYINDTEVLNSNSNIYLNGKSYYLSTKKSSDAYDYFLFENLSGSDISILTDKNIGVEAIHIIKKDGTKTEEDLINKDDINIYPSVVTEDLNIDFLDSPAGAYDIYICTTSGQKVFSDIFINSLGINKYTLESFELQAGFYFIYVEGQNLKMTKKVIVQ